MLLSICNVFSMRIGSASNAHLSHRWFDHYCWVTRPKNAADIAASECRKPEGNRVLTPEVPHAPENNSPSGNIWRDIDAKLN